jgi:hypothetical protein
LVAPLIYLRLTLLAEGDWLLKPVGLCCLRAFE